MIIVLVVVLAIALILFINIISIFNVCVRVKNKVKQSKSTIDVYLTQRFDLIPQLVECVKGYKEYESSTLAKLTELRSSYNTNKNIKDASSLVNQMNSVIMQAEQVADLKASEQFLMLQKSLVKVENQLQAARRIYNGDVTLYNTTIQTFPNNLVANAFNMKPEELFTIEEYKSKNIEVKI